MRRYSAFHSICHRQKNGQRSIFHIISLRSVLPCLDLLCLLSRMNGRVCLKHRHTHTQSNKGKSYQYVIAAMSWRRAADTHILYACVFSLTEPNVWMADDKHHLSSDIRDDRERQQKKNYCVFFLSHFSSIGQTFVRLSISPAFVWSSFHWHRRTSNGKYFSDHFLSIFLLCTCLLLVHTTESAKVICHNYLRMRLKLNPNTNNAMRCLMMRINSIWGFLTTMTTATI